MAYTGIDIRKSGDRLLFRVSLKDAAGNKVITGTTTLRLYRYRTDGTLDSYDFNDNTFKTTGLTTATQAMSARQGNNATVDTGVWTFMLTTVSGFTAGDVCFAQVNNSGAFPADQERDFQYGLVGGDDFAQTGDAYARLGAAGAGLTALGDARIANLDAAVSTRSVYAGGAVASVTGAVGSVTGNVGGNVVGSVASVTAGVTLAASAVQAIWDAATAALATAGSIGKRLVDFLTTLVYAAPPSAAAVATQVDTTLSGSHGAGAWGGGAGSDPLLNAVPGTYTPGQAGYVLGTNLDAPVSEVGTDLLDLAAGVETGLTLRQAMRLIAAAAAGKVSGAGTTTIIIRNFGDDKDRIVATVDADGAGNRTAITYDLT